VLQYHGVYPVKMDNTLYTFKINVNIDFFLTDINGLLLFVFEQLVFS